MPTSSTAIETVAVWILGICFENTDASNERTATVTDTAGGIVHQVILPPNTADDPQEFPFRPLTGLKWSASGTGVIGHIWGYK